MQEYYKIALQWTAVHSYEKDLRNTLTVSHMQLSGEVEIAESLFRRRVKYHWGNHHVGAKVWVFGMVER